MASLATLRRAAAHAWRRSREAFRFSRSARIPFKRKPLFEALEPRVLLSADVSPFANAAWTLAGVAPISTVAAPELQSYTVSLGAASSEPSYVRFIAADGETLLDDRSAAQPDDHALVLDAVAYADDRQVFVLDFDGASDVDYRGPVEVDHLDIAALRAPAHLSGQEPAIIDALLDALH